MLAEAGLCKKTGINRTGFSISRHVSPTKKNVRSYGINTDIQLVLNYLKINAKPREIHVRSYLARLKEDMDS